MKKVAKPNFKDGILKVGNKIIGYVKETSKEGWAYYIGKPSDRTVARFTGKVPFSREQAMDRLLEVCGF